MTGARLRLAIAAALMFAAPAAAIVGPARDGDAYADRVVMVLARQGQRQSVCSGVVLAPRLVLTAAHCLADAADTLVAFRRDGATKPAPVAAVARHPAYDPVRAKRLDLGLVRLAAPLQGFKFAELADGGAALGAPVTAVGFGVAREGGGPSDGRIRVADLAVAAPLSQVLLWAKDPKASGLGACHGDSGGPLYSAEGRVLAVVAWTNGVDGRGCGTITQGPLVAPARSWIDSVRARWGE